MQKKSVFELLGHSLSYSFLKQLLLFGILMVVIFAAALIVFPGLSTKIADVLAADGVEDGPFYMIFIILMTDVKSIILIAVIMILCAVFVSPLCCGISVALNESAFNKKMLPLKDGFNAMKKNYLRLLGTYALYVIITVALFAVFALFMYYFMHEWSHIYSENYMVPVMTAWIAGILFVMGGIIFSPFVCTGEKRGGFYSIARSFNIFITGGFIYNMVQLLLGTVIWGAIVVLPQYIVLLSLCEPGTSIDYLLYIINVPGNAPELWIVMILSWTVATLFMFDYSQAVFVGAMRRKSLSDDRQRKTMKEENERKDYESYRNSIRSRQTRYYR